MIKPEHFFHIHCHSHHSQKDGSIPIRDLVDTQVERGAKAIACTDHGTMTGAWFLYDHIHNVAKYEDVKHVIGLEAYISTTRDDLNEFLKNPKQIDDKDERAKVRKELAKKYHQILLAKNKQGYFNLVKIHNEAWKNGFYYSPTTTKEYVFQHADGLIATTTCLASLWCQAIMAGQLKAAEKEVYEWKEVFGEDFYVELQPTNNQTQKMVNIELIRLARKTNTPLIITNDVHYLNPEDYEFHYLLLNMDRLKNGGGDDSQKMWEFGVDDLYLKSLEQMEKGWKEHHKGKDFTHSTFEESVINISGIIEKIEHYSLENEPLLPNVSDTPPKEDLKNRVLKGFKEKYNKGVIPKERLSEYQDRVIEELKVISALEAENYILICNEITNFCHENEIGVGLGRGSAGSSLILYLLGITGIDPIKHKLIFSRFLNKNRRQQIVM